MGRIMETREGTRGSRRVGGMRSAGRTGGLAGRALGRSASGRLSSRPRSQLPSRPVALANQQTVKSSREMTSETYYLGARSAGLP
jgi:hypothetical protein